jgi:hypothetical protein
MMDKNFLEFWGKFLIEVAKGQKQMEDINKWTSQGLKGFEDLSNMFKKAYGLEGLKEDNPDSLKMWKTAEMDFTKSYKEYIKLIGMVPRDDYLQLVSKYEQLKEKCALQEETIKHLRMLMDAKSSEYGEVAKGFQELAQNQSDQFQKLLAAFTEAFKKEPEKDQGK